MSRVASLFAVCAIALSASACVEDDPADASLRVRNDSSYVIEEIYLTDTGNSDWGSNLLGGDVLFPGEDLILGVDCGFYDALLVDEDGVDCEVQSLDLCLNDALWVIRNNTCAVFGAKPDGADAKGDATTTAQ